METKNGSLNLSGERQHEVIRHPGPLPSSTLRWKASNWVDRAKLKTLAAQKLIGGIGGHVGVLTLQPRLYGRVFRANYLSMPVDEVSRLQRMLRENFDIRLLPALFRGTEVLDYGLLSTRVVTTTGVNFLVDAFQGITEPELFNFHGYGTGAGAEGVGNTALGTEFTTEYATDNVRPTGTQAEGASANIYRTTATFSPNAGGTLAVTEHGIFSQAATGGGTLWDRSVFAAINIVASADSLQTQYDLTVSAGG